MIDRGARVGWLRVHARRTASTTGEAGGRYEVYCPRQRRHVPVDACTSCGHNVGVDRRRSGVYLLCAFPTDEDLVTPSRTLGSEPLSSIMSHEVTCVSPDFPLDELAVLLLERHISGAPVVDEAGMPLGVVTKTDVLRALGREDGEAEWHVRAREGEGEVELELGHAASLRGRTVGEVMTTLVFALAAEASIARAAALMAYEGVHRVPVVSDEGRVVGIVSTMDVLRWLAEAAGYVLPRRS